MARTLEALLLMSWFDRFIGSKPTSNGHGPKLETRAGVGPSFDLADAALAQYLRLGAEGFAEVDAWAALRQPAYWRACNLIAGIVATLPLKSYRDTGNGERVQVASFLDNPAGPYPLTRFDWIHMVVLHLLVHGEAMLMHVYNNGGALIGLWPVHPTAVQVFWQTDGSGGKRYLVQMANGKTQEFDSTNFTQIIGTSLDGMRGLNPLYLHRRSIQQMHALDDASTRSATNGMLIGGLVSPDQEDVTEDDARAIMAGLQDNVTGPAHAGGLAFVNRRLKFTPWVQSNVDAQLLQLREYTVDEVCRMFGIPAHLLGNHQKATSWGTGIIEMNLALQKFTLMPWTTRIEETLSQLLPAPRFCEFDYKGLLQGSPQQEVELLINQVAGGLLTVNEARAKLNLAALPGGDVLKPPAPLAPPSLDAVPSPNPDQGLGK